MRTAVELRCCSSCCPAPTSCLSARSLWSSIHLDTLCLAIEFQKGICYLYILCMYLQEYYNLWGTERLSQSFYNAGLTISYRDSLVLSKAFLSNRVYSYICDKYTPLLWQSKGKRRIKIVEIFQRLSSCVWTFFYLNKSTSWSVQSFPVLRGDSFLHWARFISTNEQNCQNLIQSAIFFLYMN